MAGVYYLIKSELNDLCLDVCRGGGDGSKVITYKKHGKNNQLWYDHHATGTIRSKCNDLCMEVKDHLLLVKPYEASNSAQQWEKHDGIIRNRLDHNKVIEILNEQSGDVGQNTASGCQKQRWKFEDVPSAGPAPQTVFQRSPEYYLVSEKNGKVLDIADVPQKNKKTVLSMPVTHTKRYPPPKSQLWYTDELTGFVHSALNDTVFTEGKSGSLVMEIYKVDKLYQWKIDGKKIINGKGEALDIRGNLDKDGAELCSYKYNGQSNQHWLVVRI